MKKLGLLSGLALLLLGVACGGGGNSSTPVPKGNFSDASLTGQYTYHLTGIDLGTGAEFAESGVFTANGAEVISNGIDDFNENGVQAFGVATSGNYKIANDGTGSITLNLPSGQGSISFAVTMVSASKVYLVESDGFANSFGVAELQDPTAFAAAPNGSFAFRMHTHGVANVATIGDMNVSGGVLTSGDEDQNRSGTSTTLALTAGSFNPPDATGRGTGTLTDNSPNTSSFIYYVVDANHIRFLSQDANVIGIGQAERQSGGFADSSLTGNYAFGSRGDTSTIDGVRTVGRFHSDGAGNLSGGALDSMRDGVADIGDGFSSGSYTPVQANGSTTLTLNASSGTVQEFVRMVSPARAYFLVQDSSKVEDGTMDAQTGNQFTDSSMNGQFAFVMDGFDSSSLLDRVGTLQWDGHGNLLLNEFLNREGNFTTPGFLNGTYSVGTDGRVLGAVDNLSSNLIFYLISSSDAYALQGDSGVEVDGTISLQH